MELIQSGEIRVLDPRFKNSPPKSKMVSRSLDTSSSESRIPADVLSHELRVRDSRLIGASSTKAKGAESLDRSSNEPEIASEVCLLPNSVLPPLRPETPNTSVPGESKGQPLTAFRVSQRYFSEEASAKFGIAAGFGTGSINGSRTTFAIRYEAIMETNPKPRMIGEVEMEEVGAIGVIFDISVTQSKLDFQLDIFSIAAAVQLGFAKAQYSTQIFPATEQAIEALMPKSGVLDINSYEQLISGIDAAKNALSQPAVSLTPETYFRPSRILPSFENELLLSQNVVFAVRHLSRRHKLQAALSDATEMALDAAIVRSVYESFWPEAAEEADPPREVVDAASKWMKDNYPH